MGADAINKLWTESGERLMAAEQIICPWQKYPRPQMKRENYLILNGEWMLDGERIIVPFPPQSMLSGYEKTVGDFLRYQKFFSIPDCFRKERILLHFGAVDQVCEVWVNGKKAGEHKGGYLPFSLDITGLVNRDAQNELQVRVTDTLSEKYPYGKQSKKRGGMWYTPVSGIWQSVWLENVPDTYIDNVILTPDLEGVDVKISLGGTKASHKNKEECEIRIMLENGEEILAVFQEGRGRLQLAGHLLKDGTPYTPLLWNSDNPHLYRAKISMGQDCVETYFALRTINICNINGVNRLCLNGKPIFMHGVLDQGYFSDGIYLPAEEEEYERDILRMKNLGFNMLRKHIKVEPECFYYYCDLHGMLVVQDMVNNGHYSYIPQTVLPTIGFKKKKDTGGNPESEERRIFRQHTKETIAHLYNHPCIVAYTVFNEGWGQFESDSLYDLVKGLDPTRPVDSTSGWFAQKNSDFDSEHVYFRSKKLSPGVRPMFLSECGGFSLQISNHYFNNQRNYGYGKCADREELTKRIVEMYQQMVLPAVEKGLCGCVYTQLSDVEDEINGLYTYDRRVCKVVETDLMNLAKRIKGSIDKNEE